MMKKDAELKQYKCLSDLRAMVDALGDYRARPVVEGNHPTLYKEENKGKYRTIYGIRICDYQFTADEQWVLANPQMGLSFSATWDNLKFVHRMMSRKKKPVDIFWLLSEADIPADLKFEADQDNPGHYFLTVTQKMHVSQLVAKLKLVAQRLSVMRDGGRAL